MTDVLDRYPAEHARQQAATIRRLRAALRDFERWVGQDLPPEIAGELHPGDLADLEWENDTL